jgi:hypothetical protein
MTRRKSSPEEAPVAVEETLPETPDTEPVHIELTKAEETPLADKPSKESIEASIQEKLSKRSEDAVDPFVPSPQLLKEVQDIANTQGFPLNRGTEAGAALMARARRKA